MSAPRQLEHTPALVLAVQDCTNTSQSVRLLTESHGSIHVMARGSRRMSPDFRYGPLDLLQWGDASLNAVKNGYELKGFAAHTAFPRLSDSAARLASALALVDVLREGTHAIAQPGLLPLALESLAALETVSEEHVRAVWLRFQLCWLVLAGRAPVIHRCVRCDRPAPPKAPVRIDPWHGGVICRVCLRHVVPRITTFDVPTQAALRALLEAPAAEASVPSACEPNIERLLELMLAFALDRPPRLAAG